MNKNLLLFGNPNAGKTTIFNNLTSSSEKISNFEGTTVTKKQAQIKDSNYSLIDVPGTYGLASNSEANKIAFDLLLNEDYDNIISVIELTSIKKSMYLLIDLLETQNKVSVIFSKADVFKGTFDEKLFSEMLNVKILKSSRNAEIDINSIITDNNSSFKLDYGDLIEDSISKLQDLLKDTDSPIDKRFYAIQYLKGDEKLLDFFNDEIKVKEIVTNLDNNIRETTTSKSISGLIFNKRREYINNILNKTYKKDDTSNNNFMNRHFDKIALHPFGGVVLYALIMYLVFYISFSFSFFTDLLDQLITNFADFILTLMQNNNINEPLTSFIVDGIIGGVGSILVFLPQIIILFTLMSILEIIGYLPRVNVLFENLFNKIGISVHSIIPYISGFGCSIFGIIATKNIDDEKKRISTILTLPFISCSARLPVYLIFTEIFFDTYKALVLFIIYMIGIIVAILVSAIISKFIYKTNNEPRILPLPQYNAIDFKYVARVVLIKIKSFIKKAGSVILIGSIIIWTLTSFGTSGYTTDITDSFIYSISSTISVIFTPLGFDNVAASSALFTSFVAKELAVSTLEIIYNGSGLTLSQGILQDFNIASALSFMVFILLFIPCLATLGAIYTELRKFKYVIYSILISLTMGYVLSFITYQFVSLFIK